MGKMKPNPRYNVLSFRISDEERDQIRNVLRSGESINELLRIAAFQLVEQRQNSVRRPS